MTLSEIKTTVLLAIVCAGIPLHAKVCPTHRTAIAQRDNTPIIRFAIVGMIDIDRDGESDIDLVRRIIEQGGGTIDAEIDIDGKSTGQLRRDTAYIILGKLPDKTDVSPVVAQQFDALMHRSTEWRIRVINVDDLIDMGTRGTAPNLGIDTGTLGTAPNRENESIFPQRRPPLRHSGNAY